MDAYVQRAVRSHVPVGLANGRAVGLNVGVSELSIDDVSLQRMAAEQRPCCMKDQRRLLLTGKDNQVEHPVIVIRMPADSQPYCVPRNVSDERHAEIVENLLAVGDYAQTRVIVLPECPPYRPEVTEVRDVPSSNSGQSPDNLAVETDPDYQEKILPIDDSEIAINCASACDNICESLRMGGDTQLLGQEILRPDRADQKRNLRPRQSRRHLAGGPVPAP